jgi:hypothetical protein
LVGLVRWFVTDARTGRVVVAQRPNVPLAVYLLATGTRVLTDPEGTAGTVVTVVAGAAILIWSSLEIIDGDSPFRRVLGGVVLVATVAGILSS